MATVQGRLYSDVVTVTTAGTAVTVATSKQRFEWIAMHALDTNTGKIFYGNKAGDVASTTGMFLAPDDAEKLDFRNNVSGEGSLGGEKLFIDSAVDGGKVAIVGWLER